MKGNYLVFTTQWTTHLIVHFFSISYLNKHKSTLLTESLEVIECKLSVLSSNEQLQYADI